MPLPASERQLRRVVAELAGATPEDIQAVLSGLEESQRERVEALLAVFNEETGAPPSPAAPEADATTLARLSPWLRARLARGEMPAMRSGEAGQVWRSHDLGFNMTPAALEALVGAADHLRETGAIGTEPVARKPAGWFDRLARTVLRERGT